MTMVEKPRGVRKRNPEMRMTISPRMEKFLSGELDPEDFDDEEVHRMQLRDKDGHFKGRPSKVIPRELAQAFRVEQQKRLMQWYAEMIPKAQTAYQEILGSRHLQPGDAARLRAAEGIFERIIGKVQSNSDVHIVVDKGRTYEDVLDEILVDVEAEEDGGE